MENLFRERMKGESLGLFIGKVIVGIIIVTGLAIVFGFIIMWLWNQLMPEIFGLPNVNYWQAVGLFILAKILFGSSGKCGGKRKDHDGNKRRMKEKFKSYYDKHCKEKVSDWEHYDKFWETEGKEAYQKFVSNLKKEKTTEVDNS